MPNVFLTLAYRPEEFRAFFAYHDALMEKEGGLSKAEREMIVVATSAANQCHYCVIAHGAILRIRAKNPLIADQIAVNYRKADITPRQRAMLDFAMKVSRAAEEISEADFADVASHGFSDDDVWDIAAIAGLEDLVVVTRDAGEFVAAGVPAFDPWSSILHVGDKEVPIAPPAFVETAAELILGKKHG